MTVVRNPPRDGHAPAPGDVPCRVCGRVVFSKGGTVAHCNFVLVALSAGEDGMLCGDDRSIVCEPCFVAEETLDGPVDGLN